MATCQDTHIAGKIWTYDDGKLGLDEWMEADPERLIKWQAAGEEHRQWIQSNPGAPENTHEGHSAVLFSQWIEYANATSNIVN